MLLSISPKGAGVRALKEQLKSKVVKTFGGDKGSVATLYKNYAVKKSVFDSANDIVNAYSKGKPIKDTTALNRLQKIFDENKPAYLQAILDLEQTTGIDVLSTITASKFRGVMPTTFRPLSSAGGLAIPKGIVEKLINLLAFPLTSPRASAFIARRIPQGTATKLTEAIGSGSLTKDAKAFIDMNKNTPSKQGGFIKIADGAKKIPQDDLNVMSDFTEYVAKEYKPSAKIAQQLELDASRIAEKYGMKTPKTTQGLANEFGRYLEDNKFKK